MRKYSSRRDARRSAGFVGFLKNRSVVFWIILVNILVYIVLLSYVISANIQQINPEEDQFINYFALRPSNILHGDYLSAIVLHMFSHFEFWHILVNMIALFSLGSLSERIIGRKRFFWFYLLSGIFAGLLSVVLAGAFGSSRIGEIIFSSPNVYMVGASGAIFAIAGLYVVLLPRLRFTIILFPFISFPAYVIIPLVLFGFWIATIIAGLYGTIIPVGNVAHFGGFLAGVIYGSYLKRKYSKKVQMLQRMFR